MSAQDSDQPLLDSRGRSKSTFQKVTETTQQQNVDYSSPTKILVMHKASEPLDILWKNMGLIDSHFAFTRFFLFILGLIMILFLSSPAVIFTHLKKIDGLSFLDFGWTAELGWWGNILHRSGPPMIVLIINVTIINILDYASVIESYDSHSQYQLNVYFKTVIYTMLNMFMIPVLTLSNGGTSIWNLITQNNFNIAKILGELFIPKSGEFFILLLVQ